VSNKGRRVSLKVKLLGSSAILLAFTVLVGLLGIHSASSISAGSQSMYEKSVKPLAELGTARAKFNENRALTLQSIMTKDAAKRQQFAAKIESNTALVKSNLEEVGKSLQTASGKATFAELQSRLTSYRETRKQYLDLVNSGRAGEAAALSDSKLSPEIASVVESFVALFDSKVKLAGTAAADNAATASSARTQAIVLIVVAIQMALRALGVHLVG
jgi:hypothetical protein